MVHARALFVHKVTPLYQRRTVFWLHLYSLSSTPGISTAFLTTPNLSLSPPPCPER